MFTLTDPRIAVSVCETQPLAVEGLKTILERTGKYRVEKVISSLEDAGKTVLTTAPGVIILDKAFGGPAVMEWITNFRRMTSTQIIVWGAAMTEGEAIRFLSAGAKGIVRKTADVESLLACIDAVAKGGTWMEESLFRESSREDRRPRTELTRREQEVLDLVERGLRNKDIAKEMGIRPGTVKIHLKHIFEKTGVRGRHGLALSGLQDRGIAPVYHA